MYGWLWRHLPRPTSTRIVLAVLLAAAVVAALFGFVFPWVDHQLALDDGALG
jgi:MFS-type transporter involved in bile tolerance (Atg22 family)